jgi:DNA-binding NarL/FixJ family response regulator
MPLTTRVATIVIARPGRWRDGLTTLLRARNDVMIAGEADDVAVGLEMIAVSAPALVLLSGNESCVEALAALPQLKAQSPQTRFIALVHSEDEARRAYMAGADGTLVDGFTSEALSKTIDRMMPN